MLPYNARKETVISLFISLIYDHRCMIYDDAENAFWWVYLGNFSKLEKFPEILPLESLYQNPIVMIIRKSMFRKKKNLTLTVYLKQSGPKDNLKFLRRTILQPWNPEHMDSQLQWLHLHFALCQPIYLRAILPLYFYDNGWLPKFV